MTATYTVDISLELAQGGTTRLPDCLSIIGFQRARDAHTLRAIVRDTDATPDFDGKHVELLLRVTAVTGVTTEVADRIPCQPAPTLLLSARPRNDTTPEPIQLPPEPNEMVSGVTLPTVPGDPSQIQVGPNITAARGPYGALPDPPAPVPAPTDDSWIQMEDHHGRPVDLPGAPVDVAPDPRLLSREKR